MRRGEPEFLVLAMDIGTSSLRTALFDDVGRCCGQSAASRQYAVSYSAAGAAELDAFELLRAAETCLAKTLRARLNTRTLRQTPIAAVSGCAFWHSLMGLDARQRPITPIWTWADSRATPDADRLRRDFDEREVHARTGCMLRASFWPAKLLWLRRTQRRLFRRVAWWVSPADWIFAEFFGASGSSRSMASATGLWHRTRVRWDEELCDRCGIDPRQLAVVAAVADCGARPRPMLRDAQVFHPIGDGAAGNLGSGADRPKSAAINIGTSAAVRGIVRRESTKPTPFGLFRYSVDEEWDVIGGAISNAGNLRRWCLRELRISDAEIEKDARKSAAESPLDVLPFWVAERAPTWPEKVHGTITGLTQSTSAIEIEHAAICSTFYRLAQILQLTESATTGATELIVSGGILRSRGLLSLLADALGRDLRIPSEAEASIRGAAVYALQQLGAKVAPMSRAKTVRHNAQLSVKHRVRRARQEALEATLSQLR
jgi:gluconokinase